MERAFSGTVCPDSLRSPDVVPEIEAVERVPIAAELAVLHNKCAVWTGPEVAEALLDAVGWVEQRDLASFRLLEPACGDGAILEPAAKRLFRSAMQHLPVIENSHLSECLVAYEIDPAAVERARDRIAAVLVKEGARPSLARRLARHWVRQGDFLLECHGTTFTHAVANPPYLRWSKIPTRLRWLYEKAVPPHAARGDISLAFLQKSLDLLAKGGNCAFLFPDRWLRSKYGERFRHELDGKATLIAHYEAHGLPVFAGGREIGTYPAISVLKADPSPSGGPAFQRPGDLATIAELCHRLGAVRLRTAVPSAPSSAPCRALSRAGSAMLYDNDAQMVVERIVQQFPSLAGAGITVRCGTGLGLSKAFIIDDPDVVESDRLVPFVKTRDIAHNGTVTSSSWLANPWSPEGVLVDLEDFPLLNRLLAPYRAALQTRACVRHVGEWYRTIDKIRPDAVLTDKIVIAGLADRARIGLSTSPCQPGNGIYTLRSADWPLPALARLLRSGVVDLFAQVLASRLRSGAMRFDGYLLSQVCVPRWKSLSEKWKQALAIMDISDDELFAGIYDLTAHEIAALRRRHRCVAVGRAA